MRMVNDLLEEGKKNNWLIPGLYPRLPWHSNAVRVIACGSLDSKSASNQRLLAERALQAECIL
jgi:hypothetical protein